MKQLKFFKISLIALVLLNLAMMGYLFYGQNSKPSFQPPPHHPGPGHQPFERAIKSLDLDIEQEAQFRELVKEHHKTIGLIDDQQRELLTPYFESLVDTEQSISTDSLLSDIQVLEAQKIETTYNHFVDVKALLREDQFSDYEKFIQKAIHNLVMKPKKDRRPPKDF